MSWSRTMVKPGASPVNPGADWQARLYSDQGYRPADPERFPWRCAAVESFYDGVEEEVAAPRCVLVEGHDGEHRGEVTWS